MSRRLVWMSGSGWEVPDIRYLSEGPPECLGVVGSGREAHKEVREWSRVYPGCLRVVGRPSQISGSGREALPDVQEWLRGPTGFP